MQGADSRADPSVGKREKPADAARIRRCDMEAQHLHEHDMSKMLRHQKATRLLVAQFARHPIEAPAQHGGVIRIPLHLDDRWEDSEKDVRISSRKGKTAADQEEIATAVASRNAVAGDRIDRIGRDRFERRIAGETKGSAARQQKAVAFLQADSFANAIDAQPAGA